MRWYEHVTESPAFKKAYNPHTRFGATVAAVVGAVLIASAGGSDQRDCASNPLRHVYSPSRLTVLKTCAEVDVVVRHVSKERDGDLHIQADAPAEWLRPKNFERQKGKLVVEYMPGDPFDRPKVGDRLHLLGTFVADKQHGGWTEIHPVFYVTPQGQAAERVVP